MTTPALCTITCTCTCTVCTSYTHSLLPNPTDLQAYGSSACNHVQLMPHRQIAHQPATLCNATMCKTHNPALQTYAHQPATPVQCNHVQNSQPCPTDIRPSACNHVQLMPYRQMAHQPAIKCKPALQTYSSSTCNHVQCNHVQHVTCTCNKLSPSNPI